MIYKIICDYCGLVNCLRTATAVRNVNVVCPVCKSKRKLKEYETVDYYAGSPPFVVKKEEIEAEEDEYGDYPDWGHVYD
jgi:hypothetical protein